MTPELLCKIKRTLYEAQGVLLFFSKSIFSTVILLLPGIQVGLLSVTSELKYVREVLVNC